MIMLLIAKDLGMYRQVFEDDYLVYHQYIYAQDRHHGSHVVNQKATVATPFAPFSASIPSQMGSIRKLSTS